MTMNISTRSVFKVLLWYLCAYLPSFPILVLGYPLLVLYVWLITLLISVVIPWIWLRMVVVLLLFGFTIYSRESPMTDESWWVEGYLFAVLLIGVGFVRRTSPKPEDLPSHEAGGEGDAKHPVDIRLH